MAMLIVGELSWVLYCGLKVRKKSNLCKYMYSTLVIKFFFCNITLLARGQISRLYYQRKYNEYLVLEWENKVLGFVLCRPYAVFESPMVIDWKPRCSFKVTLET